MDTSVGDNSTVITVNPFAPSHELFHPPRLGIIHLLALTAATGILLMLLLAAGCLSDSYFTDISRPLNIYFMVYTSMYAILIAAGMVGIGVIIHSRLRGVGGRLQAGHWMLLTGTVVSLLVIPFWLFDCALREFLALDSCMGYFYYLAMQGGSALMASGLWLTANLRMSEAFRWKILFSYFALSDVFLCFLFLCSFVIYSFYYIVPIPAGSAIGLFFLPLVAGIDLIYRVERDWLHWLGVSIAVIFQILSIADYIVTNILITK